VIGEARLDPNSIEAGADLLWRTWQDGGVIRSLPDAHRPRDRAEGYAIQARLQARSERPRFGWKIAATSAMGQAHIGVDGPLAGRILAERVVADGGVIPASANRMAVAEPEFAFRMARDLPPRAEPYGQDEVLAAVAELHPAIEIPDSRFEDFASAGGPQLIADNACGHWFVLGQPVRADWRSLDLSRHVVVGRVEGRFEREGSGASVLGDPRIALTWLVNEVSGMGETLRKDEVVTTGTCVKPLEIVPGDRVVADFGPLGAVSVTIGS
jgi:2-keto-4-pentenoate hydratase